MSDRGEEWFAALYRAHHGDVLRYARRRVPAHEADDVVAEVFTTAWRRRSEVPGIDRLWLLATAHHHVHHAARSGARRSRLADAMPAADSAVGGASDAVLDVVAALGRLAPDDRALLTLVAWEELTPTEAAVVLGVSAAAVRVRLFRARRRLTALVDPTASPTLHAVPEEAS